MVVKRGFIGPSDDNRFLYGIRKLQLHVASMFQEISGTVGF